MTIAAIIKAIIDSIAPYLKDLIKKFVKEKEEEIIDEKNVFVVKEDIEQGKSREEREKDISNLINGKSE